MSSETVFYLAEAAKAIVDDVAYMSKERHFATLQAIAVVDSSGKKCDLIFLADGERLTSNTYIGYLTREVFSWAREHFEDRWWKQDGARCHMAAATQEFLANEAPKFFTKDEWPHTAPTSHSWTTPSLGI